MREVFVFRPPRRQGVIFHGAAILAVAGIGAIGLWKAFQAESGPNFLLYFLLALLAITFIPGLIYRLVALQRARYILARDGISLYWGLRREEIPISSIEWVGSAEQNGMDISKPAFRFPGAVLGIHTQKDGKTVEFLAARDRNLVLITTRDRIFSISPANTSEFLLTYRRLSEFGSMAPIPSESVYAASLLSRSWADRPGRALLLSSAILALGLILWVSLSIPVHSQISLRLNSDGSALELVPGIRLLLLPVLNTFFFVADILLGLFFYRREDTRSLAYLMWASSLLTSLIFFGAVYFILQAV